MQVGDERERTAECVCRRDASVDAPADQHYTLLSVSHAPSSPPTAETSTLARAAPACPRVQWPTLPEQQHYRAAPSHYASHLLGHEGAGSAYALLKERGWATALVAGEAGTSFRWARQARHAPVELIQCLRPQVARYPITVLPCSLCGHAAFLAAPALSSWSAST